MGGCSIHFKNSLALPTEIEACEPVDLSLFCFGLPLCKTMQLAACLYRITDIIIWVRKLEMFSLLNCC